MANSSSHLARLFNSNNNKDCAEKTASSTAACSRACRVGKKKKKGGKFDTGSERGEREGKVPMTASGMIIRLFFPTAAPSGCGGEFAAQSVRKRTHRAPVNSPVSPFRPWEIVRSYALRGLLRCLLILRIAPAKEDTFTADSMPVRIENYAAAARGALLERSQLLHGGLWTLEQTLRAPAAFDWMTIGSGLRTFRLQRPLDRFS